MKQNNLIFEIHLSGISKNSSRETKRFYRKEIHTALDKLDFGYLTGLVKIKIRE